MTEAMITTTDNPFDPFTQFDDWNAFDVDKGYNSCSYLARIARTSDELSPIDQYQAVEQAVNEIVLLDILGIYKKVKREV